jgi:potassium-transporting ATPase potassium-binding subunit
MPQGLFQIGLTLLIVIAIAPFFGKYLAKVFLGEETLFDLFFSPIEKIIYTLGGIRRKENMTGGQYARAVFYSNTIMGIVVYLLLITQKYLPLNPMGLKAPRWDLALHTTISFLTNTDQQHYAGETTLSYLSQTSAIAFLMFTSAATGLAVGIAFIRGLTGRELGNFYVDLTRGIIRVLLPLSIVGAIALLTQGVPQTFLPTQVVQTLDGASQYIARGPVASFEMIKLLGENGGGFFAANSAHPLENPNPATNLLETVAMVAIPSALIFTYGIFANNLKQAWLLFWMVFAIFLGLVLVTATGESEGNKLINGTIGAEFANLEGKEVRFGWAQTALWAVLTTATMCGAVNGTQDSLMPGGGFATLSNMFLRVVWGGQGTGTAFLYVFLILTVFLTGLMVGRTPEFLGRRIEKTQIFLASIILVSHPIAVLIPSAIALSFPQTLAGISNPGFHGISQVVYEYASAAANNGSGLEGLNDGTVWWNLSTCFSLLLGRYVPIIALLLLADSMSVKQVIPKTPATVQTDNSLFVSITAGMILLLGMLTFFPVLALGPIAEGFKLASGVK